MNALSGYLCAFSTQNPKKYLASFAAINSQYENVIASESTREQSNPPALAGRLLRKERSQRHTENCCFAAQHGFCLAEKGLPGPHDLRNPVIFFCSQVSTV